MQQSYGCKLLFRESNKKTLCEAESLSDLSSKLSYIENLEICTNDGYLIPTEVAFQRHVSSYSNLQPDSEIGGKEKSAVIPLIVEEIVNQQPDANGNGTAKVKTRLTLFQFV